MSLRNKMGMSDLSVTESLAGVDMLHRTSETVRYEPDCEILGGYSGNVHVVGSIQPDRDTEYEEGAEVPLIEDIKVILSIPLEMYLDIQRTWLQEKIDYCDRYEHYCGVFLGMDCIGVNLGVKVTIADGWDEAANDYKIIELPVYEVISYDPETCDPEHG